MSKHERPPKAEAGERDHPRRREGDEVQQCRRDERRDLQPGQLLDHGPDLAVIGDLGAARTRRSRRQPRFRSRPRSAAVAATCDGSAGESYDVVVKTAVGQLSAVLPAGSRPVSRADADRSRDTGQPGSLRPGDEPRVFVGPVHAVTARERGAVRTPAAVEDLVDGVAEREHDCAPVVQRVVEGEDRRLLAAVAGLRGGERGRDLIDQLPLLPELTGEVEEYLQLCGDVPESRRRAESRTRRPIRDPRICATGPSSTSGAVAAPVLVDVEIRSSSLAALRRAEARTLAPRLRRLRRLPAPFRARCRWRCSR